MIKEVELDIASKNSYEYRSIEEYSLHNIRKFESKDEISKAIKTEYRGNSEVLKRL
jgi:hypothetical protein